MSASRDDAIAMCPMAFGSVAALEGHHVTRFTYLDEAGTGKIKHDPYLIVAGIIVHADKQWLALQTYFQEMVREFVPPAHQIGFSFHAKDLFHGGKKGKVYFTREIDRDLRWRILEELCSIPSKFDLPIVCGCFDRKNVPDDKGLLPVAKIQYAQMLASVNCTIGVERFMRERAGDEEVAMLIYEQGGHAQNVVRMVHHWMQVSTSDCKTVIGGESATYVPLTRVVDQAQYAERTGSSLLQIADVCAFSIKRKIQNSPDADRFFSPLKGQLLQKVSPMRTKHSASLGAQPS
jgi:hypothetical protein